MITSAERRLLICMRDGLTLPPSTKGERQTCRERGLINRIDGTKQWQITAEGLEALKAKPVKTVCQQPLSSYRVGVR